MWWAGGVEMFQIGPICELTRSLSGKCMNQTIMFLSMSKIHTVYCKLQYFIRLQIQYCRMSRFSLYEGYPHLGDEYTLAVIPGVNVILPRRHVTIPHLRGAPYPQTARQPPPPPRRAPRSQASPTASTAPSSSSSSRRTMAKICLCEVA